MTNRIINDLRRELRWGYKDQSIRNFQELVKKIKGCKTTKGDADMCHAVLFRLCRYVNALNDFKRGTTSLDQIKQASGNLMSSVTTWERSLS